MTLNNVQQPVIITEINRKMIQELIRTTPTFNEDDFFPLSLQSRQFIGHYKIGYIWEAIPDKTNPNNFKEICNYTILKFLKRIFPQYACLRKRFANNSDLFPFYPTSVERQCKWAWIYWKEFKNKDRLDIQELINATWQPKLETELITICQQLSKLSSLFCKIGPHWSALMRVCHGNLTEMAKCFLYWGMFELQVHPQLKRRDNLTSFEYTMEENNDNDNCMGYYIRTRNAAFFQDRVNAATSVATVLKSGFILSKFNGCEVKYEKEALIQSWHQRFYGHTHWRISLAYEDRMAIEQACNQVIDQLLMINDKSLLETVDSVPVMLGQEIAEEFTGTEEFLFDDLEVINYSNEEINRNQYAANARSWQTLWNKLKFLDARESYLQGFLTKDLKVRYDSIEKWEKMGWIKRETKEERKIKGRQGKGVWYKLIFLLEGRTEEDEPIGQAEWKTQATEEERGILEEQAVYGKAETGNFSFSRTLYNEGMGKLEF